MIMKPMPKATKEIKALADTIYQRMVAREDETVEKVRKVIEFATNDDCGYSRSLSTELLELTDTLWQAWLKV